MSWIRGNATDYKDLSDILVAAAVGNSIVTVDSVSAGGTGYVVGEIITFTTGTFTEATQLEVLTLSGSAVATVRIYNAGIYSVNPSDSSATTSSGSGTGATFTHTYAANGWTLRRDTGRECSAVDSIVGGGTGYSVDDIITLDGGVTTTPAQLRVTTESAGVITAVSIETVGDYDVIPTDPVAQQSVAPTGGSGATFNLSFDDGEQEVILEGNGGGTDEIFIGWRTLSGSGYYNFELHGMTGWDADLKMYEQPGVSPGFHDNATATIQAGAYLLCHNSPLTYFLNINSYRMVLEIAVGSAYFNAYLGFGNRFATVSEYPYPMLIAGHTSNPLDQSTQGKFSSGLTDPWTSDVRPTAGPMFAFAPDNNWYTISNGEVSVGGRVPSRDRTVLPAARTNIGAEIPQEDRFMGASTGDTGDAVFEKIILDSGSTGNADFNVEPIPGTTEARWLLPAIVVSATPSIQVFMELDEVFWLSSFGDTTLQPEDRVIVGSDVYRVFKNCNRTDPYAFLAIKEA